VKPSGAARAVRVHKRRARYSIGGCMAEASDLEADGRAARTIAVESEDPPAVAAVRDLGLAGHVNVSHPRGLAALVDATPVATR
jgi:exopolyphosphatase/guanosine-5'-triphosphate,3'-diphosphate pyrophosphatase